MAIGRRIVPCESGTQGTMGEGEAEAGKQTASAVKTESKDLCIVFV